ncbi:MAG: hypothetical protein ABIH67_02730 [Candidatus Uhrbacteria bacterium]
MDCPYCEQPTELSSDGLRLRCRICGQEYNFNNGLPATKPWPTPGSDKTTKNVKPTRPRARRQIPKDHSTLDLLDNVS